VGVGRGCRAYRNMGVGGEKIKIIISEKINFRNKKNKIGGNMDMYEIWRNHAKCPFCGSSNYHLAYFGDNGEEIDEDCLGISGPGPTPGYHEPYYEEGFACEECQDQWLYDEEKRKVISLCDGTEKDWE